MMKLMFVSGVNIFLNLYREFSFKEIFDDCGEW